MDRPSRDEEEPMYEVVTRNGGYKRRVFRSSVERDDHLARLKFSEGSAGSIRVQQQSELCRLPVEILLGILAYLGPKELRAVSAVCGYFAVITRDATLWKEYEICNDGLTTSDVVNELKRMPKLKRIRISDRADCERILRQIALSNKKLEQLHVYNCTGTTDNLYLRPHYLNRILQCCLNLHTFNVEGTRFRGCKFYRLLGRAGRLRAFTAHVTRAQFETFVKHVNHIADKDRELLSTLALGMDAGGWIQLTYEVRNEQPMEFTIGNVKSEERMS